MFICELEKEEVAVIRATEPKSWVTEKTGIKFVYEVYTFNGPLFNKNTKFKHQDRMFGQRWEEWSRDKKLKIVPPELATEINLYVTFFLTFEL